MTAAYQAMGLQANQAIRKYLQRAARYEKLVLKDKDPENLHQMRVALRRLRTVMQVFSGGIQLPKAANDRRVAQVSRCLGKLRDLDVIAETLSAQFVPDLPDDENRQLKAAFKALRRHRKRALAQVKTTLKGDRYRTLKKQLQRWSESPHLNLTADRPVDAVLPDITLPLLSRLWLAPGWLVGTHAIADDGQFHLNGGISGDGLELCLRDNRETLHDLRKRVKHVRYQLGLVAEFYGDRLDADLARFKTLQEQLGLLQDSWVLETFLADVIPHWAQQLPTLAALLRDRRHHAWQQWRSLQAHYLDPAHQHQLRYTLMHPGDRDPEPPLAVAVGAGTAETEASTKDPIADASQPKPAATKSPNSSRSSSSPSSASSASSSARKRRTPRQPRSSS